MLKNSGNTAFWVFAAITFFWIATKLLGRCYASRLLNLLNRFWMFYSLIQPHFASATRPFGFAAKTAFLRSCCKAQMLLQGAATPRLGHDNAVGGFPVKSYCKLLTKIIFLSAVENFTFLMGCCKALKLLQGAEISEWAPGGFYDYPGQVSRELNEYFGS